MKKEKTEKKILISAGVLVLAVVLIASTVVFAQDHTATQEASTSKVTTISIVGKVADTAVSTITFPEGAPSATVSDPYNNVDTDNDPQVVASSDSEPVVRLKNTSAGTLKVWLGITDWTNGVVASQDYELVETTTTTVAAVEKVLSSNGNAATVDTTETIAASAYKALYLEIVLSTVAGKSSTSTLSVLGESS